MSMASEQLRDYRSNHRIRLFPTPVGEVCATDGIPVHRTRNGRYRHDVGTIAALLEVEYGGIWPSGSMLQDVAVEVARDQIREDWSYQREWERTSADPAGIEGPTPCTAAGHVFGCAGRAGGDHALVSL